MKEIHVVYVGAAASSSVDELRVLMLCAAGSMAEAAAEHGRVDVLVASGSMLHVRPPWFGEGCKTCQGTPRVMRPAAAREAAHLGESGVDLVSADRALRIRSEVADVKHSVVAVSGLAQRGLTVSSGDDGTCVPKGDNTL